MDQFARKEVVLTEPTGRVALQQLDLHHVCEPPRVLRLLAVVNGGLPAKVRMR
jgi:hypothetical protein